MSVREFEAPDGRRWRVWSVRPNYLIGERRARDRRATPVESLIDPPVLERRRGVERRQAAARNRRALPGELLPRDWQDGWLVFADVSGERPRADAEADRHGRETRRLAPIPACWDQCDGDDLIAHWRAASPTSRPRAREVPRRDAARAES